MVETTNVLIALKNILDRNSSVLTPIFRSNGTANAAGDSLEFFVKDMFCSGASQYQYKEEKERVYNEFLSWGGDTKHFPDFIVKGGVGVEPKKINGKTRGSLALNSSYPKDYIYPDSQNIPPQIDEVEEWSKKDIVYVVGNLNNKNNKLLSLWMAYGNTFIADRSIYLSLIEEIRKSISKTEATLKKSQELARAIGIDPLHHSNLRVRGMYELRHPALVFGNYVDDREIPEGCTEIHLVLLKSEYERLSLDSTTPDLSLYYKNNRLLKKEVSMANPNNPTDNITVIILSGYTS